MYPPLEMTEQALQTVTATFKHVIVLTDGVSTPGDFQGIVQQMSGQQITVSTVAVGEDSDVKAGKAAVTATSNRTQARRHARMERSYRCGRVSVVAVLRV